MGFAVLIGELITLRGGFLVFPSIFGFLTAFTLTGSSMVVNDFFDRFVDAVNQPNRPIPSGLVGQKEALLFAGLLGFCGLFSAFLTSWYVSSFYVLVVALFSFLLSLYYNAKGKEYGFLGNLMVSACVAIPFIYGAFIVGETPQPLLLTFTSMAFLANTGREIIKGIADIEGDKLRNVQTLALKLNPKKAAYVAAVFYNMAVGLSILPIMFHEVSLWYLPFVTVACLGFVFTSFLVIKNPVPKNAEKMKKFSLVWMGFGLLAFMFGGIL